MPSTEDLITAISNGNLDRVQEILIERDPQGIPCVDVNHGFGNAETALLWALWCNPINELIVQTLLDIRDNANNPVSDINHKGPHGRTVLSCVLSRNIEPNLRSRLLQRILDVRGANGELVTNVAADECNIPLLKQAQELNDINCFRILQDARTSTGEFALDINEIRYETTVLDSALKDGIYYRRDQTMIDTIQQLGGLSAIDGRRERRQQQRLQAPVMARQEVYPPMDSASIDFLRNGQSTHLTEVTVSVAASIKRLKIRYPDINSLKSLQEIRSFLDQLPHSDEKEYAIHCLNRIERDPTEHALSDRTTLPQALALIWTGMHDKTALVDGLEELTQLDVEWRKHTLMTNLFKAQTEYGFDKQGVSACFVGTLNQVIEILDLSHPDVTIIRGPANILPVATERARIIVRDELKKKSLREQRHILNSWGDLDSNNGKTMATEFREEIVGIVDNILEKEFQQLLTKKQREEITGQFEYLPFPVLHVQLDKLINTINQMHDNDNPLRQAAIVRLKEQANHSYDERDRTLQKEYELLLNKYNSFVQLDLCVLKINQLEEGDGDRKKIITELKEKANQSYLDRGRSFQTELDSLKSAVNIKAFKSLYDACLNILKIGDDANNSKRQACIQTLRECADVARKSLMKNLRYLHESINLNDFFGLDELINKINCLHHDNCPRQVVILSFREQFDQPYEDFSKTFSEIKTNLESLLEATALEARVDSILGDFENKIDSIGNHHLDANLKARELLNTLKRYKKEAFQASSNDSLTLFAQRSEEAIKEAISVLQRDLGWGDYLVNLAKQLMNITTMAVASVVTLGTSKHHGFFAVKLSDAVNQSQELTNAIQNLPAHR